MGYNHKYLNERLPAFQKRYSRISLLRQPKSQNRSFASVGFSGSPAGDKSNQTELRQLRVLKTPKISDVGVEKFHGEFKKDINNKAPASVRMLGRRNLTKNLYQEDFIFERIKRKLDECKKAKKFSSYLIF